MKTVGCLAGIVIVAAVLRVHLSLRPGLWVDEVFSLAMATGHSVEHAAALARPELGDFVLPHDSQGASSFAAFAEHDRPAADLRRVVRAVSMSDTNPPLYYLLLWGWTRVAGTSDAALRLLSTFAALICVPLLWILGRQVHSNGAGMVAALLFALSPPALYYSAEGRMYALTWSASVALATLTIALPRAAPTLSLFSAWVVVASAGLLTHYFFAFVWVACVLWLTMQSIPPRLGPVAGLVAATGLAVSPWYARVPETLGYWRVTAGWLDGPLTAKQMAIAPLRLAGDLVFWGTPASARWLAVGMASVFLVVALARVRNYLSGPPLFLCSWLCASIGGVVVFDLWRGTITATVFRYALPALPAVLVLLAITIADSGRRVGAFLLGALVVCWLPSLKVSVFTNEARPFQPLPEIARRIDAWVSSASSGSMVVVHTIPTGLIGLSRYMTSDVPVLASVIRLTPASAGETIDPLMKNYGRTMFVRLHDLSTPSAIEAWLRQNAHLDRREQVGAAEIQYYALTPP